MAIWIAYNLECELNFCLSPLFQVDTYFKLKKNSFYIKLSTSALWKQKMSFRPDPWRWFSTAYTACALLTLKMCQKFQVYWTHSSGGSHYFECLLLASPHWKSRQNHAESISQDVPARRWQTAMPAPKPSAKILCNNPLAQEAGMPDVDWVFGVGIPEKNVPSKLTSQHYLQFCLWHIKLQGKPCTNKEIAKTYHICAGG